MTNTEKSELTALREEVALLRAKVDPRPVTPEAVSVDKYLALALDRMEGDAEKAAGLFMAWTEQNSEVREALKPLVREAIERRIAEVSSAKP